MCFFSPNTDAFIPLRSHATTDRAPDHLADSTPAALRDDLTALLGPTAVRARVRDLVKYATDASPYRLFPQVVIVVESVEQISKTLQYARQNHHSVTIRAAGSSLNGQSRGDDILIDVRNCSNGIEVLEDGHYAKIKPGTITGVANRALLPHNRVLGPDHASSSLATVGGVVANNASGMTAGTKLNSYQTIASMKVLLPSCNLIDTGDQNANNQLLEFERELHEGLLEIQDEILRDESLAAWIRKKFASKNTNGYRQVCTWGCQQLSNTGGNMNRLKAGVLSLFLVLCVGTAALGQDAAHDVKDSTIKTGHAVKHLGKKVGSVSKTTAKGTAKGTKAAAKDTAHGTEVASKEASKGVKTAVKDTGKAVKDGSSK